MDEPDAGLPCGETDPSTEPATEARHLTPVGARGATHELVSAERLDQQRGQSLRGALPMLNCIAAVARASADGEANPGGRAV